MNTCIFVSRHAPSDEQFKIAELLGYTLLAVGDCDAFNQDEVTLLIEKHRTSNKATAVACVHPLIAIKGLRRGLDALIFENANRAGVGEKPDFHCCGVSVVSADDIKIVHYQYDGKELH